MSIGIEPDELSGAFTFRGGVGTEGLTGLVSTSFARAGESAASKRLNSLTRRALITSGVH